MMTATDNRLTLTGALKIASHRELRERSAACVDNRDIEVDMTNVTEVDSSAVALVLYWRRRAHGHRVTILNPPAGLVALADLYGVGELLGFASGLAHSAPEQP
jgi:phospholipid transport system transporter-binding protein